MKRHGRLFVRIWFAMIAGLVLAAIIIALAWRWSFDGGFARGELAVIAGEVAGDLLPAGTDAARLQASLERWGARLRLDLALHSPSRAPIAASGRPLPPLPGSVTESGWLGGRDGAPGYALRLPDGRWLLARRDHGDARHPIGFVASLALAVLALGALAWPVARRLTRRLERLRASVESLGEGNLSARVTVRGHDEIAALAASFNRAAARIEALVEAQKSLLANASHELRSPLARLRMSVESLQAAATPEMQAGIAQDIAELDQLIDEIILASRLDAGLPPSRPFEEVDLAGLLAEECARVDADLDAQPTVTQGDPVLLRRMVRNLLENARRHGGASPVEVQVRRAQGDGIVIEVRDRGPGVPEHERERIFEPFYRLAEASERAGGAGLGLALVRRIAGVHGGTVACTEREGGGSCFVLNIGRAVENANGISKPCVGGA